MIIRDFTADADIVGRRVKISWVFEPQGSETVADIFPVILRRKYRDFEFTASSGETEPYVVYNSAVFPPTPVPDTLQVTDLPEWETQENGSRTQFFVVSVAGFFDGRPLEILRRTIATTYGPDLVARSRKIEIIDNGGAPFSLEPGRVCYYQLFGTGIPTGTDVGEYRDTVTPGEGYGFNRKLYDLLPALYKRHDVVQRQPTPGSDSVPESAVGFGQLRRFLDMFGAALDSMRSTSEGIRRLQDIDETDYRLLPYLSQWIGWQVSYNEAIPLHRNEIKSAARFYRAVGSVPGLRATVTRYTGWHTQVAEFAQHISRSNQPSLQNIFVITPNGSQWSSTHDASEILGFGPGNREALGTGSSQAVLTGSSGEPFALFPDIALNIVIDGIMTVKVRFSPEDFQNMAAATALEVRGVLGRIFQELTIRVLPGGILELATEQVGSDAMLTIEPDNSHLISLENSPTGRLNPFVDSGDRCRLFYETWLQTGSVSSSYHNECFSSVSHTKRHLRYKTYTNQRWRDSHPVDSDPENSQGCPASVELPDERIWLTWVEQPFTASSRLKMMLGNPAFEEPARLFGKLSEPFRLIDGTFVTFQGNWPTELFTINSADYADLFQATAAEVTGAMSTQLANVIPSIQPDGTISLASLSRGPDARLKVNLQQSTAARTLGFSDRNLAGQGKWDDLIQWSSPQWAGPCMSGRYDDLSAVADPSGGVYLFWSQHQNTLWRIWSAHWDEHFWAATNGGVSFTTNGSTWSTLTTVDGLPHNDVRAVAVDASGSVWFATAAGLGLLRPGGVWSVVNTGNGLSSNDIRDIAIDPDGNIWLANNLGIDLLDATGIVSTTYTTADGLAGNDVRAIYIQPDRTVWVATSAGASRFAEGVWQTFDSTGSMPANDIRSLTIEDDNRVWFATANGLAVYDASGQWRYADQTTGLASNDVRDVAVGPDGTVWAATGAGLCRFSENVWHCLTTANGLLTNDILTVSIGPDLSVWAGTTAGCSTFESSRGWRNFTTADGLSGNIVRDTHGPWSSPLEVAGGLTSNREPFAVVDDNNQIWLLWARRQGIFSNEEHWLLFQKRFDPTTFSWSVDQPVTTTPLSGPAVDRKPSAQWMSAGGMRVFFNSDRGGSRNVWSLDVSAAGIPSLPVSIPQQAAQKSEPAPVLMPHGDLWLFYRSDDNVALSQAGSVEDDAAQLSTGSFVQKGVSQRLEEGGTLRRYAGSTTPVLTEVVRNMQRRHWGDLQCYTPQKPRATQEAPLEPDEFYTNHTLGLYVSRARNGRALTPENVEVLQQLLSKFMPINLRAIIVLNPSIHTEYVYTTDSDIEESYMDIYPNVDIYSGLMDSTSAALPDWSRLLSNTLGHVSADPISLLTLRRRTYYPDPE